MKLVKPTPVPADIFIHAATPEEPRTAWVVAKATFRFSNDGTASLDADDPFPIFTGDQETDLGLLPRDDFQRIDRAFEVVLLGAAYSSPATPATEMTVALEVGETRRELIVTGDRVWENTDAAPDERSISEPKPFDRIPITWERTFGGQQDVEIDKDSYLRVSYPWNPPGKGFDPETWLGEMAVLVGCPEGYPKYPPKRPLPNVELPTDRIEHWDDMPASISWSTVPMENIVQVDRGVEFTDLDEGAVAITPGMWHRAHPDWVIEPVPPGSKIVLNGLTPIETLELSLPDLRLVADCVTGEKTTVRKLVPQTLVLLPDEKRFYLVYRTFFRYRFDAPQEREIRLRAESNGPST